MFNNFLQELYNSGTLLVQELKATQLLAMSRNTKGGGKLADEAAMRLSSIDDKKIFACKKEDLAKTV